MQIVQYFANYVFRVMYLMFSFSASKLQNTQKEG